MCDEYTAPAEFLVIGFLSQNIQDFSGKASAMVFFFGGGARKVSAPLMKIAIKQLNQYLRWKLVVRFNKCNYLLFGGKERISQAICL